MRRDDGFTLIETVIYIGLFALIMGSFLLTTYQIIEAGGRVQDKTVVAEEGNFLHRKLGWALNIASSFTVTISTLTINAPSLPVAENPLVFSLLGTDLYLTRGSGIPTKLNSVNVEVLPGASGNVFTDIPAHNGQPEGVSATFIIGNQSFENTKYLPQ